jgi:hypothetical protein
MVEAPYSQIILEGCAQPLASGCKEDGSGFWKYQWTTSGRQHYMNFMKMAHSHPATKDDWKPARECVDKADYATWWDWRMGSRPFFWKWRRLRQRFSKARMRKTAWDPPWVRGRDRRWARDGQPHFTFPTDWRQRRERSATYAPPPL